MALVLLTTSDAQSSRRAELERMIGSVSALRDRNPDLDVRMLLLMQRVDAATRLPNFPSWVDVHVVAVRISLSKARNRLLELALEQVSDTDIVAFPDDDCWYPDGLGEYVFGAFADSSELDFWFCRYASQPRLVGVAVARAPGLQDIISFASSNTIFLRGRLVKTNGQFDERLGVGAVVNGGEDTEYALRAHYGSRERCFVDAALVGHRDSDASFRSRYYAGSMVAILRHAGRSGAGVWAAFRKLLVGVYMVVKGKMTLKDFGAALKLAWKNI